MRFAKVYYISAKFAMAGPSVKNLRRSVDNLFLTQGIRSYTMNLLIEFYGFIDRPPSRIA